MSSIKHDNNRVSKIRKKKLEEYVEEELSDQSFNRSRSLREKYRGGKKRKSRKNIFATRSNGGNIHKP